MSKADVHTEDVPEEDLTFTGHLEELRSSLVKCIIAGIIGFLACYGFAEQLFDLLMAPLVQVLPPGGSLIYTGLPEGFFTYLKVAMLGGLFVASPYIFYQIWSFIAPGLYESERKYMLPVAFFSALFFVSGAAFGYLVVFPFGFDFFMGFATDAIQPMPSLKEYFSFSTKLLIAFGLVFELPLFIFFLARMGLVTPKGLRSKQKYAILCSFVISAILTPPDIISQVFMSGPLIVLYEVGIWVAHFFGKKTGETAPQDDPEEDAPVPTEKESSGSGENH
jgi:sec-independent protein translocase protein TatC